MKWLPVASRHYICSKCDLTLRCSRTEFWARYARWLEPRDAAAADEAVRRAAEVHCKRRPEALLLAARHAERRGRAAAARSAYERVLKSPGGIAIGSLAVTVACANFERRQARWPPPGSFCYSHQMN